MYNNYFKQINNNNSPENKNIYDAKKPYHAPNILINKVEKSNINDTGTLDVRVFTALGALPIDAAVVTVYTYIGKDMEVEVKKVITDANGIAPPIELPVVFDVNEPYVSPEHFFTHYNLRVNATGYYTIHIVNIHVFPNIKVLFNVNLTPVAGGSAGVDLEKTIVIPNPNIDISN